MNVKTTDIPSSLCEKEKTDFPGHWSNGVKRDVSEKENIVHETNLCTVIKDKYPKAKHHYLILPKEYIHSISYLNTSHIDLIRHMIAQGEELGEKLKKGEADSIEFKLGFHALPSMALLHMHVISSDFDSPCLKHKRHWNSFTTSYFRPANVILAELDDTGHIAIDEVYYKNCLKKKLECHICHEKMESMPKLKEHVKSHFKT